MDLGFFVFFTQSSRSKGKQLVRAEGHAFLTLNKVGFFVVVFVCF